MATSYSPWHLLLIVSWWSIAVTAVAKDLEENCRDYGNGCQKRIKIKAGNDLSLICNAKSVISLCNPGFHKIPWNPNNSHISPYVVTQWSRNGQQIVGNETFVIEQLNSTLTIPFVTSYSSGLYSCEVQKYKVNLTEKKCTTCNWNFSTLVDNHCLLPLNESDVGTFVVTVNGSMNQESEWLRETIELGQEALREHILESKTIETAHACDCDWYREGKFVVIDADSHEPLTFNCPIIFSNGSITWKLNGNRLDVKRRRYWYQNTDTGSIGFSRFKTNRWSLTLYNMSAECNFEISCHVGRSKSYAWQIELRRNVSRTLRFEEYRKALLMRNDSSGLPVVVLYDDVQVDTSELHDVPMAQPAVEVAAWNNGNDDLDTMNIHDKVAIHAYYTEQTSVKEMQDQLLGESYSTAVEKLRDSTDLKIALDCTCDCEQRAQMVKIKCKVPSTSLAVLWVADWAQDFGSSPVFAVHGLTRPVVANSPPAELLVDTVPSATSSNVTISLVLYVLCGVLSVGAVTVGLLIAVKCLGRLAKLRQTSRNGPYELDSLHLNATVVSDNPSYHPVPTDQWEIPMERLQLGDVIGQGEFGVVYKGEIFCGADSVVVAVKTLKENASEFVRQTLLAEFDVMKKLSEPGHDNVIQLIGKCIRATQLHIVTEYADRGSLKTVLDGLCREVGYRTLRDRSVPHYVADLMKFAQQIANGMAYLELKKIIHCDLAARNILVTGKGLLKVSDFGMTWQRNNAEYYTVFDQGLLPVRWMAPESLTERKFTSKSDRWSFGILMWEIFSLGATPYPSLIFPMMLDFLVSSLKLGQRMAKPSNAPMEIYKIMLNCWQFVPRNRPTFCDIRAKIDEILDSFPSDVQMTTPALPRVEGQLIPTGMYINYGQGQQPGQGQYRTADRMRSSVDQLDRMGMNNMRISRAQSFEAVRPQNVSPEDSPEYVPPVPSPPASPSKDVTSDTTVSSLAALI